MVPVRFRVRVRVSVRVPRRGSAGGSWYRVPYSSGRKVHSVDDAKGKSALTPHLVASPISEGAFSVDGCVRVCACVHERASE